MPLLYCTSLTAPFIGLIGLISSTHKLGTRSPISNTLQTRKATLMSPYPAGAPSCSPYSSGQLQTSCLSPLPFTVTLSHFAPVPTLFWFLPLATPGQLLSMSPMTSLSSPCSDLLLRGRTPFLTPRSDCDQSVALRGFLFLWCSLLNFWLFCRFA